MASTCIHDSRAVCASSPDGCSRRSFLDQCDMYEYNCDYGSRYDIVDCAEKCKCCETNTVMTVNTENLITNPDHDVLKPSEGQQIRLNVPLPTLEPVSPKVVTANCYRCGRPNTWATTANGETRDFFRILKDK